MKPFTAATNWDLLRKLCETPGLPGREAAVREVVDQAVRPLVDGVRTDRIGNLIAHRAGPEPAVAFVAHMDEVGGLVTGIEECEGQGYVRFRTIGGIEPQNLVGQRMAIHGRSGALPAVVGSRPDSVVKPEALGRIQPTESLFIDPCLSIEDATARISPGDGVTFDQCLVLREQMIRGKALDDRLGLFVSIEALRRTYGASRALFFVASVQEEAGICGAPAAARHVPAQAAISLDITPARDYPNVAAQDVMTRWGGGVSIGVADGRTLSDRSLVAELVALAERHRVPHQMRAPGGGGTDASGFQLAQEGMRAANLLFPTRYGHTAIETAHRRDIEAAIDLLALWIEKAS